MFPKKFYGLVFSFVMSVLMSGLMSLVITLLHVGIRPGVVIDWFKACGISWIIAWPTIMIVSPLVNRIVTLLVRTTKED